MAAISDSAMREQWSVREVSQPLSAGRQFMLTSLQDRIHVYNRATHAGSAGRMGAVACCLFLRLRLRLQESRSLVCEVPCGRHDDPVFGAKVGHYPTMALGKHLNDHFMFIGLFSSRLWP